MCKEIQYHWTCVFKKFSVFLLLHLSVTSFHGRHWFTWSLSRTLCPCTVRWIVSVAVGNSLLRTPLCWKQLFAHWTLASVVRKVVAWYRCEQACPRKFQAQRELEMCCSLSTESQRWSLHLGKKKAEKSADFIILFLKRECFALESHL